MDVGLRHARPRRDRRHRRAGEAALGEHRLGRREDRAFVALADARPGDRIVHFAPITAPLARRRAQNCGI